MDFSKDQVAHLAKLAKLSLHPDELNDLGGSLESILAYVDKLNELDVSDVEPTTHAVSLDVGLREDVLSQRLSQQDVLANAPDVDDAQFRVPKVVSD